MCWCEASEVRSCALCASGSSNSAAGAFCCVNVTLPSTRPAGSAWKWSDVLWRSDADCAALSSLSLFPHVCCYGACLASPTTQLPSANYSISTWLVR